VAIATPGWLHNERVSGRAVKDRRNASRSRDERILRLVTTITCGGLAIGMIVSLRLWYATARLYPRAPVIGVLRVPPAIELALVSLTMLSLITAVARRPWTSHAARAAAVSIAALVVLDQSRLQPWVYEYVLLLVVISFAGRKSTDAGVAGVLATCRMIVVALYFWSAVQKMNVTFLTRTWPDFSAALSEAIPALSFVSGLGWVVPVAELAFAAGLLSRRFRGAAVVGAVAMHATIMIALVAAGENSVVWPWNAAMAALVLVLFWKTEVGAVTILRGDFTPRHVVVTVAVGALPVLSFFGWWDPYLCAALYAGNTIQTVVVVTADTVPSLRPLIRGDTWQQSEPMFIDVNRWSYDELNVPAYPAERVMKRVGREICDRYLAPGRGRLLILGRPHWRSGARTSTYYDCAAAWP
jgi:hypothetical protein